MILNHSPVRKMFTPPALPRSILPVVIRTYATPVNFITPLLAFSRGVVATPVKYFYGAFPSFSRGATYRSPLV